MSGSWMNAILSLFGYTVLVPNIHIMTAKAMRSKLKLKYFNRLSRYLLSVNTLDECRLLCLFYNLPYSTCLSSVINFDECRMITAAVFGRTPIPQCLR